MTEKRNEDSVPMAGLDTEGVADVTDVMQQLLDAQRAVLPEYQARHAVHYGGLFSTTATRIQALTDNAIAELVELKNWLPWKYWKKYASYELSDSECREISFEVIDVMHMLVEILLELGVVSSWEVGRLFMAKNALNRERLEGKHGYAPTEG